MKGSLRLDKLISTEQVIVFPMRLIRTEAEMNKRGNNPTGSIGNGRRSKRRRRRPPSTGLGGEMARRSSDIYPINRFELTNQGSEDRSNTYIEGSHGSLHDCTGLPDTRSYTRSGNSVT